MMTARNKAKLRQISKYCKEHDNYCTNCVYKNSNPLGCSVIDILHYLANNSPDYWDFDEIDRLTEETENESRMDK